MSGIHVKLMIPAEREKGGKDRIYPVTPDFAEFLRAIPEEHRTGHVFNMQHKRGGVVRRVDTVSKQIRELGKLAAVKVNQKGDRACHAAAHDLRRAFGTRWARRVPPLVLKELMRHESVTTTERYYVEIDADTTAEMLLNLMPEGDTLGDTSEKPETSANV